MTREEAIEILIAVAVCDRPILSCDFCARYVGMGTDCTYPSDKEIEESVLLLKGASNDAEISAIRQQEHFREVTKKVEPLTLEELRKMGGEPVFVVTDRLKEWCLVHSHNSDDVIGGGIIMTRRTAEKRTYQYACYGKTWLAYRQKPEEGTV